MHPSALARDDRYYMELAFNQAIAAWEADEVPIGAIIVVGGAVVGKAHNMVEASLDPTAHAEILAITQACRAIGDWRLNEATLYVTKEPCPMCSGAVIMARLGRVVYAVADPKMGCLGGAVNLNAIPQSNHRCTVEGGLLAEESRSLLRAYFQFKRQSPSAGDQIPSW